jgi:hypothetical protein
MLASKNGAESEAEEKFTAWHLYTVSSSMICAVMYVQLASSLDRRPPRTTTPRSSVMRER